MYEDGTLGHTCLAHDNLRVSRVLPISHCPPQLPGQVAPCSPSWQEQMLGAIQMPLPQPNEQRAERRNAVRGWGLGPPQTSPGNEHPAGEDVWDRHLRRVQCPLPMEGAQPGQQPLPNPDRQTCGPSRRLQERRERLPRSDWSTEQCEPPSQSGSRSTNGFLRPSGGAMGSFRRKTTSTASPESRTNIKTPVSYGYLPHEHRAKSGQERGAGAPALRRKQGSG